jgi:hypothetical protein
MRRSSWPRGRFYDKDIPDKDVRDDTADYLVFLLWQEDLNMEEKLLCQLPKLSEEEAMKLNIATLKLQEVREWQCSDPGKTPY